MKNIAKHFACLLLFAMCGFADPTHNLVLKSVSTWYNGVSVGMLGARLDGNSIFVVCDDYDRTSTLGVSVPVKISTLDSLEYARFDGDGEHTQLQLYQQASWLLEQLWYTNPSYNNKVGLQYAIWNVFSPTRPFPDPLPPSSGEGEMWFALAQDPANYDKAYPNVRILTDGPDTQEFMTIVVPEPVTISTLCAGLLGLIYLRRRRR